MNTKNALYKSGIMLSVISIFLTLYFYKSLPSEIPIHFNFAGEADNYGPRSFTLFTALLPLIGMVFFNILPKIDPKGESYKLHAKAYNIFILFTILLFMVFHWISLFIALGFNLPIQKAIPICMGILFIIIGNYMPQIRPNYTYGIKLPWTLGDEDNWRATHRIGGYCYLISGILFILIGFLPPSLVTICMGIPLIFILLPMLYSYIYFKKHTNK